VRASIPNADELLWPGTLFRCGLRCGPRMPSWCRRLPCQVSQQGNFVYVVKDNGRHRHAHQSGAAVGRRR